jgi:hypothetical protein
VGWWQENVAISFGVQNTVWIPHEITECKNRIVLTALLRKILAFETSNQII